jgi:hypothetical protein
MLHFFGVFCIHRASAIEICNEYAEINFGRANFNALLSENTKRFF